MQEKVKLTPDQTLILQNQFHFAYCLRNMNSDNKILWDTMQDVMDRTQKFLNERGEVA